jgi:hypothetical protein
MRRRKSAGYDPSRQDVTRPLENTTHEQLCVWTARGHSWIEVSERIGMSTKSKTQYYRIKRRPECKGRIEYLKAQIAATIIDVTANEASVTREEVTAGLRDVVMKGLEPDKHGRRDLSSVVKAYTEMGRSIGMFTDRKILEGEETIYDSMGGSEIEELLFGMLGQLDPNQVRSFLGRALESEAGSGAPQISEGESDSDVSSVSETDGVPRTRH